MPAVGYRSCRQKPRNEGFGEGGGGDGAGGGRGGGMVPIGTVGGEGEFIANPANFWRGGPPSMSMFSTVNCRGEMPARAGKNIVAASRGTAARSLARTKD